MENDEKIWARMIETTHRQEAQEIIRQIGEVLPAEINHYSLLLAAACLIAGTCVTITEELQCEGFERVAHNILTDTIAAARTRDEK